jgi:nickel-dependent lactate racemase
MRVQLQYGREGLAVDLPSDRVTVLSPRFVGGLTDEAAAFREAAAHPLHARPLREVVGAGERVAIVIPDITRPCPTDRILPLLFAELAHVPADQVTIINGTGSHRANTPAELSTMVGAEILSTYRVVNHDAQDRATLAPAGTSADGRPIFLQKDYVEADRRIVVGFIEPHFMAGFSGGFKGIFPAIADLTSIRHYHRAAVIGHPKSTWGVLDGNPTQDQIRHNGALVPVDFCVNVTVNRERQITQVFCGEPGAVFDAGTQFARETAMQPVAAPFPIVLTTNSGYPLDQNLYQTVKGMSAAAQIIAPGGLILAAARCNDGFPAHGNFRSLLYAHASPRALLDAINGFAEPVHDQWEAQLLAIIRLKARVGLYSELPAVEVRRAHCEPIEDLAAAVAEELARIGPDAPIAVLPEGPMTIPYLS